MGLIGYYRRFNAGFSRVAYPITSLQKKVKIQEVGVDPKVGRKFLAIEEAFYQYYCWRLQIQSKTSLYAQMHEKVLEGSLFRMDIWFGTSLVNSRSMRWNIPCMA